MPLLPAKCSNCGANLQVDSLQSVMKCPYCRCNFIVQQAIHNYNIANNININANVVNIYNITTTTILQNQSAKPFKPITDNPDFIIEDNVLKKYIGNSSVVAIPNGIVSVAAECFMNCAGISKIIVPDTVLEISKRAFKGCINLTEIKMPERLKKKYGNRFDVYNQKQIALSQSKSETKKSNIVSEYKKTSSHSNTSYYSADRPNNTSYKSRESAASEYARTHQKQFRKKDKEQSKDGIIITIFHSVLTILVSDDVTGWDKLKLISIILIFVTFLLMCPYYTIWALANGVADYYFDDELIFCPIVTVAEILIPIGIFIYKTIKINKH